MEATSKAKAIIMARVSSKEQEEEGYSVDAQVQFLTSYCESAGLQVEKVFKIAETASKHQARHQFNAMMEYATKKRIPHLVIEKVDRATRNSKSAVELDEWLNLNDQRKLHLPKNSLILHKNSTSQDRFMWDIHIAVAKQYANNLREEVLKGVTEKLKQGWYAGNYPPLGYKNTGDKGHKIQVIDHEKAPLVKLAFELYDTGNYSVATLTKELGNQGLYTNRGNKLSKSHVHKLLRDKFYIGIMTWNGKEYAGAYEPLISEDLFERVQNRLTSGAVPVVQKHMTLLRGKIKCESCRATISWYKQKGYWYGECKSNKPCKARGTARQDRIEEELANYFNQLISPSPAIVAWVKKELRRTHHEATEQHQASIKQLTNRYRRLENQLSLLYEDRLDERISPELYDRTSREKREELDLLSKQIEKASVKNRDYINQAVDILDLTQNAADIFMNKPLEEQRILLGDIFSGITLNGKYMKVTWRPETAVVRDAVEKTKKLDEILEPSSDPSKMELSEATRSIWYPG